MIPELKRIKQEDTTSKYKISDPGIQRIIDLAFGGKSIVKEQKNDLILKAQELFDEGHSKCMVVKILNLNFRTVSKYIDNDPDHINTSSILPSICWTKNYCFLV